MKSIYFSAFALFFFFGCTSSVQQEEDPKETTQPVDSASTTRLSLEKKGLYIEVSPEEGGRISSLKLNGQEFLSLENVHPTNWGSTFWISPQSIWGWPPPIAFDSLPYAATKTDSDQIIMQGSIDKEKTGTSISKTISLDPNGRFVDIEYEIKNETDTTIMVAPWEITRVPINGLSFYPGQEESYETPFDVTAQDGYVWFDYKNSTIQKGHSKLVGPATDGWLGHVNGNLLLVKLFPHSEEFNAAPKEGEIEIYAHPEKLYIELEPQGEYKALETEEIYSWKVRWYLKEIPTNISVEVGSSSLTNYVNTLVKSDK